MPSTEFIQSKNGERDGIFISGHLRVFILYTCPVCRRYTIHGPRFDARGYCYVDHKRLSVLQRDIYGNEIYIGTQAVDKCFVAGNHPASNIEKTRTVIRVK